MGSRIDFSGTQTLGGTGTVVFNNVVNYYEAKALRAVTNGMTLTIGSGITIRGGSESGSFFSSWNGSGSGGSRIGSTSWWGTAASNVSVVNQGTITADASGRYVGINPSGTGTFTNSGSIKGENGGTLYVNRASGTIATVAFSGSSGAVVLDGTYTLDQRVTVNAGQTLTLNGTWTAPGWVTVNGGTCGREQPPAVTRRPGIVKSS